jgi:predicted RNA-binding Zn ribbon-like protein
MMFDREMETLVMRAVEMAPEVALIVEVVNTHFGKMKRLREDWPDRAALESWLHERGLIAATDSVSEGDYRRVVALREALRTSLRRADDAEALATINHFADHALLKVHFTDGASAQLAPESGGVDGVIARLLGAMLISNLTGTLARVKICQNHACSSAFYDGSKNQSAVWCSARVCGNRMHARAYRQQKKALA